jgi:hypothetical protein
MTNLTPTKSKTRFKVIFNDEKKGIIQTPFLRKIYNQNNILINIKFSELYEGCYHFGEWNVLSFHIKTNDVKKAVKLAKNRLNYLFNDLKLDFNTDNKKMFYFTGSRLDDQNNKNNFQLSFMENTHLQNQFTKDSYIVKKGAKLIYDCDGDGWGFWYEIDENNKRISDRLKGATLNGLLSDGVLTPNQI